MNRNDFLKKIIRGILLALMALLVFGLGNRIAAARDCSTCPGKGICSGETDCNKF
jgi:hypothetical protein